MTRKKIVLTIAGSDSGAGAGVQSDLKTFHNIGVYGVTVITAITSQNTKGVQSSFEVPAAVIKSQLTSLFNDFKIKFAKTGMLSSAKVIESMYPGLKKQKGLKLVIDPVLSSKNGFEMLDRNGIKALIKKLIPLSYLITPNIYEAEILSGLKIQTFEEMELAAFIIHKLGARNVLIKGGHINDEFGLPKGTDLLYSNKIFSLFPANYIAAKHTHGIGCALSAAITANLAIGKNLEASIIEAKAYVQNKLQEAEKLGRGINPVEQ
ncbi:MAG TPA: bifunctional hydroxymethylpyrimidine kinase/phosphomethylpyrimidine kinase [Ignavibacteria bacterium]|jgi:hydroxymethylpyrimidine/phosphomethylpyrimidine kinase